MSAQPRKLPQNKSKAGDSEASSISLYGEKKRFYLGIHEKGATPPSHHGNNLYVVSHQAFPFTKGRRGQGGKADAAAPPSQAAPGLLS